MRAGVVLLVLVGGCVFGQKDGGGRDPDRDDNDDEQDSGDGAGDSEDSDSGSDTADTGPVVPPVTACADGGDHPTIQAAVDAVEEGGTVEVCAGVWHEHLSVSGKTLTVRSAEGAAATVLEGDRAGTVVTVLEGGDLTLQGFTVQGGDADVGGGARCDGATLRVRQSIFTANTAGVAGGLGATACEVVLSGNTWTDNESNNQGGAVYVDQSDTDVDGDVFENNRSWHGGALMALGGSLRVTASTFTGNFSQGLGGALEAWGAVVLSGNTIVGNSALYTGGGIHLQEWTGDVVDNEISENSSEEDGGGVFLGDAASGVFARNIVTHNSSNLDDAGGVRVFRSSLAIEDNVISWNTAAGAGGGMKISHNSSTITGNTFEGNSSGDLGGGLEVDDNNSYLSGNVIIGNSAVRGGGLHLLEPFYDILIDDTVIADNVATDCGGGVAMEAWDGDDAIEGGPGAFPATFRHVVVSGNQASDGAGLCQLQASEMRLNNSIVWGNAASRRGGGFWGESGGVALVNAVVYGNSAGDGAGLGVAGGGWMSALNSIVASNSGPGVTLGTLSSVTTWTANDIWSNDPDYDGVSDRTGAQGNLSADPLFTNAASGDFTLAGTSPCVDAGDTTLRDPDGSPSDIGAYGGPSGAW